MKDNAAQPQFGYTIPVCCNSYNVSDAISPNCFLRNFCCSCRCVWAKDATATIVCTTFIVVISAGFQYSWWATAADIDSLRFWQTPESDVYGTTTNTMQVCIGEDGTQRIRRIWFPAVAVQFALMVTTLFLMWSTTLTNPGILPKKSISSNDAPTSDLTQVQHINGMQVYRPYCGTCNIIRPVRASHCATCNNCVERFDHHCGMIGACVGRRNFRFFFAFLCAVALLCGWSGALAVVLAIPTLHCSMLRFGFMVVVILFAGLLSMQLTAMTAYFIPLVARNITKREDIKLDRLYHQPPFPGAHPFDKGSCIKNCSAMLCEPHDAVDYV